MYQNLKTDRGNPFDHPDTEQGFDAWLEQLPEEDRARDSESLRRQFITDRALNKINLQVPGWLKTLQRKARESEEG